MVIDPDDLQLAHGEITREVIGAFYEVYNILGYGYGESVFANALPVALAERGLRFEREAPLAVRYRDVVVGVFRADLIVEGRVLVELKVAERIAAAHESQVLNYLRASGLRVALILNFGAKPAVRRLVWSMNRVAFSDIPERRERSGQRERTTGADKNG